MEDNTTEEKCPYVDRKYVLRELEICKAEVEEDLALTKETINVTRNEVVQLRQEVHALRTDVHGIREGVNGMKDSLETIATSISKLTDFPETWDKLKSFWSVVNWLKTNFAPIAILIGLLGFLTYLFIKSTIGLIP